MIRGSMTCAFPKVAGASLLLALCAGSATIVTAQTAASQRPATPARDATKEKPATGVIKGRVLSADGRPLRRAQVRVTAAVLRDGRTASTDTEGNYELTD